MGTSKSKLTHQEPSTLPNPHHIEPPNAQPPCSVMQEDPQYQQPQPSYLPPPLSPRSRAFFDAAREGDFNTIQEMLDGTDDTAEKKLALVETRDLTGFGALLFAVRGSSRDIVALLIHHGANPYCTSIYSDAALRDASLHHRPHLTSTGDVAPISPANSMVAFLIESCGIDPTRQGGMNFRSPLTDMLLIAQPLDTTLLRYLLDQYHHGFGASPANELCADMICPLLLVKGDVCRELLSVRGKTMANVVDGTKLDAMDVPTFML